MSVVAWLVIGAIAGYAANWILRRQSGMITTVLFGIVGAILGGLVGSYLTGGGFDLDRLMGEFDLTSIVVAIVGAVALGAVGGWWNSRRAGA